MKSLPAASSLISLPRVHRSALHQRTRPLSNPTQPLLASIKGPRTLGAAGQKVMKVPGLCHSLTCGVLTGTTWAITQESICKLWAPVQKQSVTLKSIYEDVHFLKIRKVLVSERVLHFTSCLPRSPLNDKFPVPSRWFCQQSMLGKLDIPRTKEWSWALTWCHRQRNEAGH